MSGHIRFDPFEKYGDYPVPRSYRVKRGIIKAGNVALVLTVASLCLCLCVLLLATAGGY